MNYRIISFTLGRMMLVLSVFLLLPLLCAVIFKESTDIILAYIYTIVITLSLFVFMHKFAHKETMTQNFYTKEGLVIVALTWLMYSTLGSLPFVFSNAIPSYVDALFETTSGFTTTGSTILRDIESLPKSLIFWRSLSHFIGGLGVVIFALAILPRSPHNIHIMKAETPGPMFGKLMSSMKSTAVNLYALYIGLTLVLFVLLLPSGIGIFEAINLSFSTAGTGGFATKNTGIAFYNNDYVTFILSIFMLVFSLNMNLVYLVIVKRYFQALKSEELKWFISFLVFATGLIIFNIYYTGGMKENSLLDIFFTVSSIISTTGFTNIDFSGWTMFSQIILLGLMIIGGCAGSTSGGLKIPRIMFIFKNVQNYIKKCINPNKISTITIEKKSVDNNDKFSNYLVLYLFVFSLITFILSIQINDFEEVFTLVISTLNNIGPGFNSYGPMDNFADVPSFSKVILSLSMLLGRLEIIPFIILFAPQTWRRKRNR
ncbi:MAG: TrkH family potassium uptake protein [Gemella sp.]|nr:TrkH family potassium uptake protein [Gemella sp.]